MKHLVMIALALLVVSGCKKKSSDTEATEALFGDTFDRADEPLTTSSIWTADTSGGASYAIVSQKLKLSGSSGIAAGFNASPITATDYVVAATLSVSGGTVTSLEAYLMGNNSTPQIFATNRILCGINMSRKVFITDGTSSATGTSTLTLSDGTEWDIVMARQGDIVTCSVSGNTSETVYITTVIPNTNQYFGLVSNVFSGQNYLYWDDFVVGGI